MEYPEYVKGIIYYALCAKNWKDYIGQTRTHYLIKGRWVETGTNNRWKAHISEAYGNYSKECGKLNRSIRKYGADAFTVETVHICNINELDYWERRFISELDTIKYGLNITPGGRNYSPTKEMRQTISDTIVKMGEERLSLLDGKSIVNVKLNRISSSGLDIASLTFRTAESEYIKIDFGGLLRTFDESLKRAIKFALHVVDESKIVVQDRLSDVVNLPKAQKDDKNIANSTAQKRSVEMRYEKLKALKVESIRIEKRLTKGVSLITLVITCGVKTKYVSFGGKLVDINESLDNAVTLALRLVDRSKILTQSCIQHKLL